MIQDVTDEELLVDIFNTEREADAYFNIATGFAVLSQLPENEGDQKLPYLHRSYVDSEERCRLFLKQLLKLKTERGLT